MCRQDWYIRNFKSGRKSWIQHTPCKGCGNLDIDNRFKTNGLDDHNPLKINIEVSRLVSGLLLNTVTAFNHQTDGLKIDVHCIFNGTSVPSAHGDCHRQFSFPAIPEYLHTCRSLSANPSLEIHKRLKQSWTRRISSSVAGSGTCIDSDPTSWASLTRCLRRAYFWMGSECLSGRVMTKESVKNIFKSVLFPTTTSKLGQVCREPSLPGYSLKGWPGISSPRGIRWSTRQWWDNPGRIQAYCRGWSLAVGYRYRENSATFP